MNRIIRMTAGGMAGMAIGLAAALAGTPPPPPGNGGGIAPPSAPPPGRIFFEDNVVIVGPGFVKPDSNGGTVFIDVTKLTPAVKPDGGDTDKTVDRVVRELSQTKSQVEAGAVAVPPGLLDPAGLLMLLFGDQLEEQVLVRDPATLADDPGAAGASVQAAPGAPAPHPPKRAAAIPSYWQLPIP